MYYDCSMLIDDSGLSRTPGFRGGITQRSGKSCIFLGSAWCSFIPLSYSSASPKMKPTESRKVVVPIHFENISSNRRPCTLRSEAGRRKWVFVLKRVEMLTTTIGFVIIWGGASAAHLIKKRHNQHRLCSIQRHTMLHFRRWIRCESFSSCLRVFGGGEIPCRTPKTGHEAFELRSLSAQSFVNLEVDYCFISTAREIPITESLQTKNSENSIFSFDSSRSISRSNGMKTKNPFHHCHGRGMRCCDRDAHVRHRHMSSDASFFRWTTPHCKCRPARTRAYTQPWWHSRRLVRKFCSNR